MVEHAQPLRNRGQFLPKLIGLLCALVALAACVLAKVDPAVSLLRALLAFIAGSMVTKAWYVLIAARVTDAPPDAEFQETEERRAA